MILCDQKQLICRFFLRKPIETNLLQLTVFATNLYLFQQQNIAYDVYHIYA